MNSVNLTGQIVPVTEITAAQREQMFALMERYYAGVRRRDFEADLNEKQWVIRVLDGEGGGIRGFSTQQLVQVRRGGRLFYALFSGDTIVDRDCWTRNPLARMWGRLALTLIDSLPSAELYWFLISKGFRTYRFLPLFFREFYPRHGAGTPAWAKNAIDALGRAKFPDAYDAERGIVRASAASYRLRPGVGDVTSGRVVNADIRYFVERNPGYASGDELCCIAPLARENFTAGAYRIIGPATEIDAVKEYLETLSGVASV